MASDLAVVERPDFDGVATDLLASLRVRQDPAKGGQDPLDGPIARRTAGLEAMVVERLDFGNPDRAEGLVAEERHQVPPDMAFVKLSCGGGEGARPVGSQRSDHTPMSQSMHARASRSAVSSLS